jgi:hypothetical protein
MGTFSVFDMACGHGEPGNQKSCIFGVSGQGSSGSDIAAGSVPNLARIITAMGKTLSGTLDEEQILLPPPDPVQVSGAAITGEYVFDSPATGRGTGQSTTPGPSNFILYNVSDFEVILLESDTKSSQPVFVDLRQDPGSPFDY